MVTSEVVAAMMIAADVAPDPTSPWLAPALTVLGLLVGGGGIGAIMKARHDSRVGVAQQEVAEDDALSARWRAIIETQTKSLLEPLQERLTDVEANLKEVKAELEASRRKYWSAISHIRTLYTWISRHLPPEIEQTQIPEPPATLAEDI